MHRNRSPLYSGDLELIAMRLTRLPMGSSLGESVWSILCDAAVEWDAYIAGGRKVAPRHVTGFALHCPRGPRMHSDHSDPNILHCLSVAASEASVFLGMTDKEFDAAIAEHVSTKATMAAE